ncbi:MAG: hypothetical protein WA708_17570 [Acidobacteriaceae bacterium]
MDTLLAKQYRMYYISLNMKKAKKPSRSPNPKAVRFNETLIRGLEAMAKKKGTTLSAQVQTAVSEYLERQKS